MNLTGMLVGAGIILLCNALGWIFADYVKKDRDADRWIAFAYAGAIGVLCAVIW